MASLEEINSNFFIINYNNDLARVIEKDEEAAVESFEVEEGVEVEEVAKAMRSSSHLWFKVASKYAEQAIAEVIN